MAFVQQIPIICTLFVPGPTKKNTSCLIPFFFFGYFFEPNFTVKTSVARVFGSRVLYCDLIE